MKESQREVQLDIFQLSMKTALALLSIMRATAGDQKNGQKNCSSIAISCFIYSGNNTGELRVTGSQICL